MSSPPIKSKAVAFSRGSQSSPVAPAGSAQSAFALSEEDATDFFWRQIYDIVIFFLNSSSRKQ